MRKWVLFFSLACVVSMANPARIVSSTEPGWPQFRGPRRDGISTETNLLGQWPAPGPNLLWSAKQLGRGFSSPAITSNRLFVTGDVGDELQIFAFDLSGSLVWKATNGLAWKDQFPGARCTPTFSNGRLYHLNAHGLLAVFESENGKPVWSVDVLKKFGGKNITWGISECLAVDDRAVYLTAGGSEAGVAALDKVTGELIWKSAPLEDTASYVSPILVEFAGRRLLIGCTLRKLYCVDAATGAIQFTQPFPTAYGVLASSPAVVGDAIFMTAPHGKGGRLLRLLPGEKIGVEEVWSTNLDTCQGGVLHVDGKLIGSYYGGRKGWAALDAKNGLILYQGDFVKGSAAYADGRLYILSEDGTMRLFQATESEFKKQGEFALAKAQSDAWAHPVILDGRMYLRYHETLNCYDINAD